MYVCMYVCINYCVSNIASVSSAVAMVFVCFAEDPHSLKVGCVCTVYLFGASDNTFSICMELYCNCRPKCMYVCMCVYLFVCIYVCVCMYACMYV